MPKFNKGDRVILTSTPDHGAGYSYFNGEVGWTGNVVSSGRSARGETTVVKIDGRGTYDFYSHDLQLQESTNTGGTMMQKLSLIAKKTFDKDTKTLIEAGILDSELRVDNTQFVLDFIANQFKTELAAIAKEQLAEESKSK